MDESDEIGAYEAKTRLPAFLRAVQVGSRFTITQRGKPVAELVPYGTTRRRAQAEAAERMKAFMRKHEPVADVNIKAMIEDGRD